MDPSKCRPNTLYTIEIGIMHFVVKVNHDKYHLVFHLESSQPTSIRCFADSSDILYHYKTAQEKMEDRSILMILRNIIGDPHFSW